MELSKIQEFYRNKSILITGATGFVGKILLLKLLISCPNIDIIYVLIRSKSETSSDKRLSNLLNSTPFSYALKDEDLDTKKVIAIDGDITRPELGLSESDKNILINNVSVVFHCAASIKFDAPLKESLDFNVLGTKEVIDICKQMKHLQCFIHCSTAYSHCQRQQIEEIFYDMSTDPNELLKLSKWLAPQALDQLAPHLMNGRPNSYTYTKALAEKLVFEELKEFPVAVVRPSIVGNSEKEPIPGWIDNVNGPSGISVLATLGILRCVSWNYYAVADFVPVDKVANALIAIGWAVGQQIRFDEKIPRVYNVTSSNVNPITWGEIFDYGYEAAVEAPSIRTVRPFIRPPKQRGPHPIFHPIKTFFTHWMFAYFLDLIIMICGHKRIMVRITYKMYNALHVMNYFTQNQWTFKSDNLVKLWNKLDLEDKKVFNFNMASINWSSMARNSHYGNRRYLLKESDDNISLAQKRMQKIIVYYWIFKLFLVILLGYLVISWTPVMNIVNYFSRNLCYFSSFTCDDSGCVLKN